MTDQEKKAIRLLEQRSWLKFKAQYGNVPRTKLLKMLFEAVKTIHHLSRQLQDKKTPWWKKGRKKAADPAVEFMDNQIEAKNELDKEALE